MKILVLSYYYTPDIGPGALRAESIVKALNEKDINNTIHVITSKVNRYNTFSDSQTYKSNENKNPFIKRIYIPKHKNGMLKQAYGYFFFAWKAISISRKQKYDIVVSTSSRLMTAFLGALIAKRVGAKLYLDIRDLFNDTIKEVLSKRFLFILLPLLRIMERFTFVSATKINVVSGGFVEYIKSINPNIEPSLYTNGIDEEFINKKFFTSRKDRLSKILYAGNIGEGQGLSKIIPKFAKAMSDSVHFTILGAGSERADLEVKIKNDRLANVKLESPVERTKLLKIYMDADILFLHLNDYKAFQKVLPSKIFEYAATGKPILAGVDGYAAQFLRDNVPGVVIFHPQNLEQMISAFKEISNMPEMFDRKDFCENFLRKNIMKKMAEDIYSLEIKT